MYSYSSYCPFVQPLYHAKLHIFNYKIKGMYTKCINLSKNKLLYVYVNTSTCMFALRASTIFILPFINMKVLFLTPNMLIIYYGTNVLQMYNMIHHIMHIFQWDYFCSWKENFSLINTTFKIRLCIWCLDFWVSKTMPWFEWKHELTHLTSIYEELIKRYGSWMVPIHFGRYVPCEVFPWALAFKLKDHYFENNYS